MKCKCGGNRFRTVSTTEGTFRCRKCGAGYKNGELFPAADLPKEKPLTFPVWKHRLPYAERCLVRFRARLEKAPKAEKPKVVKPKVVAPLVMEKPNQFVRFFGKMARGLKNVAKIWSV